MLDRENRVTRHLKMEVDIAVLRQILCKRPSLARGVTACLAGLLLTLTSAMMPAMAKTSVWLDDTTELRYGSGWYSADGQNGDFIDINIRDVDIYERGQQRGFIEKLIIKTDGIGENIVAVEELDLKNFSYATDKGETLTIARMSSEHLMISNDARVEAYRQRHSGTRPLRSIAEITDIRLYLESENIEMEVASIRLDGMLTPTQFDALPNSSRSNLALNALTFRQIPGDRQFGEIDAFFEMLGEDQITLDINMDFQSTKTREALQLEGALALSVSSLLDMDADFTMDLTKNDYQALNQLTEYYIETQTPHSQEAVNLALLSSFSSLSFDLVDRGILNLLTQIQGDQGTDITIMMMQVGLSEMLPRHALAIGTPIAAFLRQGGRLQMRSNITPRLSPTEMLALQFDPERLIDRMQLRLRHTPE